MGAGEEGRRIAGLDAARLMRMAFGAGADALIVRDGAILLAHRMDRDVWVFPGGAVDSGETPWDAAVREAAEEVGVQASVILLGEAAALSTQDR